MRSDLLALKLGRGSAKVAQILGQSGVQYRPVDGMSALTAPYASPMLAFDVDPSFSGVKPAGWGAVARYVLSDRLSDTRVGDVLVCGGQNFFVAAVGMNAPALCIACDQIVSVSAVSGGSGMVVSGCPAAIILRSKGESVQSGVPGAAHPGQFILYLPHLPGVMLHPYMTVMSDNGATYMINSAEKSAWGLRCILSLQQV
ncbi:hypothetical protein [Neokomagataea thailandica]|uniref:Uncharacterized protein n=1 Tax=Neokomagataea tanensis NBRC 106556 TaxID=1223519 RepID=A0ABQ0QGS0_9PROT|nr:MULTISPECIES: hypothetical protein [Neokomagataea]GBR44205.1 hypothetical protein AA106556_0347 [Neokomagataea tanensis NBRC 106556]